MKKSVLRSYAQLIARMGANVRKGQEVIINAELDQPEFVKYVVEECYRAGASRVIVEWSYQPLSVLNVRYRTVKNLGTLFPYEEARLKYYADTLPAMIYLESSDPDGLKHMNAAKRAKGARLRYPLVKGYQDAMEGKYQWCIAAVPGEAWARKLFPGCTKNQAVEKLWEAILSCARVTGDPIQAWKDHNQDLQDRCDYLNSLNLRELRYKASNGTDLSVGLIPDANFCGGSETSLKGVVFNPNIPSEECFTSPMKGQAEGIVYSTMPLSYQGSLIENFWIRFHEGKAVEWKAEKNQELLTTMLGMDEGASYLGECALVPYDSPIHNSGILFYNTLFDENAACHLALGFGFQDTLKDYGNISLEEARTKGINDSMIHVDFMIGCGDLDITGITEDGKEIPVFRKGNWAF